MYLRVAVVAGRNAVIGACGLDLLVFHQPVGQPFILVAGLEETAAAAAAIIVRLVWIHIDEIFLTDHGLYDITQIISYWIAERLAHDLTGILYSKLDFEILVPIAVDLQFSFTYPFCIVFINIFNDKIVRNIEFFQSCQDRVGYVTSFRVEKNFTPQFFGLLR